MKQGIFFSISLVLVLSCLAPLAAQPNTRSIETICIDDFDTSEGMAVADYAARAHTSPELFAQAQPGAGSGEAAAPERWTWSINKSKFMAENYPKWDYISGIPNSLRTLKTEAGGDPGAAKILGIQASYTRKGDNWFEVYPSAGADGKNIEIPLTGTVSQIDFWVWGTRYRYFLEVLVRDAVGLVHIIPAGALDFSGWKNVVVKIPAGIPQRSRLRSGPESMNFVGFRIKSDPREYVDDFVVYFDDLKYTTNVLSNIYDGYDLRKFSSNGGAR
ncbi:MAG: flagellar filament outer layer protein FlaA [Spirochaetaceae bacterium]|nr:flagellar filament outer layer protein FlaA [Spirochaetaceae bacterium]